MILFLTQTTPDELLEKLNAHLEEATTWRLLRTTNKDPKLVTLEVGKNSLPDFRVKHSNFFSNSKRKEESISEICIIQRQVNGHTVFYSGGKVYSLLKSICEQSFPLEDLRGTDSHTPHDLNSMIEVLESVLPSPNPKSFLKRCYTYSVQHKVIKENPEILQLFDQVSEDNVSFDTMLNAYNGALHEHPRFMLPLFDPTKDTRKTSKGDEIHEGAYNKRVYEDARDELEFGDGHTRHTQGIELYDLKHTANNQLFHNKRIGDLRTLAMQGSNAALYMNKYKPESMKNATIVFGVIIDRNRQIYLKDKLALGQAAYIIKRMGMDVEVQCIMSCK